MKVTRVWNIEGYEVINKTTVTKKGYPTFQVKHIRKDDIDYLYANGRTYRLQDNATPFEALEELKKLLFK